MKFGTIIDVEGRGLCTVVYHGFDGWGAVEGERNFEKGAEERASELFQMEFIQGVPAEIARETDIPKMEFLLKGERYWELDEERE